MSTFDPEWIVPPETLLCNALALPCTKPGQPAVYYVLVLTPATEGWALRSTAPFAKVAEGASGSGYRSWTITVTSNKGGVRQGVLHLQHADELIKINLEQAGSAWLQEFASMVLNPPPGAERARFPLAMELGAAGKFIGAMLKKIPLPYRVAAYAIVSGVILAASAIVVVARASFTHVPEPPDYFSLPHPPKCAPIEPLMTVELIKQQTELLIAYIGEQLL